MRGVTETKYALHKLNQRRESTHAAVTVVVGAAAGAGAGAGAGTDLGL